MQTTFDHPLEKCPRCGYAYLEEYETFFEGESMTQLIKCVDCGMQWEENWIFAVARVDVDLPLTDEEESDII